MESCVMVLHPGPHVGEGVDAGIARIVNGINNVLTKDNKNPCGAGKDRHENFGLWQKRS